jgi:predicted acyl esterase
VPETTFGKPPRRRPRYKGVATESLHVPMSDGGRIAVDVLRPRNAPVDLKLPAILIIARYWRSFALRGFAPPGRAPIGPPGKNRSSQPSGRNAWCSRRNASSVSLKLT